jgi:agmatine/peptidylarginine deiminase
MDIQNKTPRELGYYFPAEFAPHLATWLSWPHKEASWPGKINTIFPSYSLFIKSVIQPMMHGAAIMVLLFLLIPMQSRKK